MEKRDHLNNLSSLHRCDHGGKYSVKDHDLVEIDFSSNVNPLGISAKVLKVLNDNIHLAYSYPDPHCKQLKNSISEYIGSDIDVNDNIIVGNGATELIHYFSSIFIKKNTLIPSPSFCEYELAAKRYNAKIIFSQVKKNFELDSDSIVKIANNIDNSVNCIFLCNPNNPTGKNAKEKILDMISKINHKVTILLDESYIEFTKVNDTREFSDFIGLIKDYKNLIILRSLTKAFGLAGLRIGYAVANKNLIDKLSNRLVSWNVNGLAQAAAVEALNDKEHLTATRINNSMEKNRIFQLLKNNTRIKGISTDANFYLIRILSDKNSSEVTNTLLQTDKILVRDCRTFTGMNDKFIRVAIKTPKENDRLLKALETLI